jgi:hypothetical protein
MYEVIDLDTDESRGTYQTLSEARYCVRSARIAAYEIWRVYFDEAQDEPTRSHRVEHCQAGDDERMYPRPSDSPSLPNPWWAER